MIGFFRKFKTKRAGAGGVGGGSSSSLNNNYKYYTYLFVATALAILTGVNVINSFRSTTNLMTVMMPSSETTRVPSSSSSMRLTAITTQQQEHRQHRYRFPPHDANGKDSFGACLKIMDDNHWLVEWLAYHWFVMPLRHLIVLVDKKSKTSPLPILNRWTSNNNTNNNSTSNNITNYNYMTIKVVDWDFQGARPVGMPNTSVVLEHRGPHHKFLEHCMKAYKQSPINWTSFVILTDTDEFFSLNPEKIASQQQEREKYVFPSISRPGSVMTFLKQEIQRRKEQQDNVNNNSSTQNANAGSSQPLFPDCTLVYRSQICDIDNAIDNKTALLSSLADAFAPLGFHAADFLTLRWLHRGGDRKPKDLINIGAVPVDYLERLDLIQNGTIHSALPGRCTKRPKTLSDSLFQIYHYDGTIEQRNFRNDIRGMYGSRQGGTKPQPLGSMGCIQHGAADLRPWLNGFVDMVGTSEAKRLLEGVGRVDGWPVFSEK